MPFAVLDPPDAGSSDSPDSSSSSDSSPTLDRYAKEFARLVERLRPHRGDAQVAAWMRGLPNDAFRFYESGISTYGSEAETPDEQRGRLYLIHTALLFMWMSWGKEEARAQFRERARAATRRVAYLVRLETYRRTGLIDDYTVGHWFWQPIGAWTVRLRTERVRLSAVPDDALADLMASTDVLDCTVEVLASLRQSNAV